MPWGNKKLHCCPSCGSADAATIDSRYLEDTGWRRRRRECHACRHRWSTVELPAELVGDLRHVFAHLKTIERLTAESRLMITTVGFDAHIWDETEND